MPITLPIVSVQPTFGSVIDEVYEGVIPYEEFWLSCYKPRSDSIHAKVTAVLDERNRDQVNLNTKDGKVKIYASDKGKYLVDAPSFGIVGAKLFIPAVEYADPDRSHPQHPHRITAFDVAPDGSQFATGFLDGSVHLYPNTPSFHDQKQISRSHKSTVTSIQFFPSSRVLLTAGADFTLNILPAEISSESRKLIEPVRNLRGHSRSITSTAIISRGRNILSSSSDGTLRLWDVSSGSQISLLAAGGGQFSPVTQIALGDRGESELTTVTRMKPDGEEVETPPVTLDSREVDTSDKLVFCSLQSGRFEAFDLHSKKSVFVSSSGAPLMSIVYSPSLSLVATGSSIGTVTIYDTRSLSSPLTSFSRNASSIEDLAFVPPASSEAEARILISTADALPYLATVRPEGPGVIGEIVGGDCDAARVLKTRGTNEFWTASDDGIVRKYISW